MVDSINVDCPFWSLGNVVNFTNIATKYLWFFMSVYVILEGKHLQERYEYFYI